jgi:hypothetical protein
VPKPSDFCWPALLQQRYPNLEVINLAKPGNSNQGIFRDIVEYFNNSPCNDNDILMFHGTLADRLEIASDEKPQVPVSWVLGIDHSRKHNTLQYNTAKKMYLTHLYNDEIGVNLSMTAMLASYGFATGFNIKFVWSLPLIVTIDQPNNLKTTLNFDTFKFIPRRKFMWKGLPMHRMISPELHQHRVDTIMNHDFSGIKNSEFNAECIAPDNHVNNKGHSIYFEKVIIPTLQNLL